MRVEVYILDSLAAIIDFSDCVTMAEIIARIGRDRGVITEYNYIPLDKILLISTDISEESDEGETQTVSEDAAVVPFKRRN